MSSYRAGVVASCGAITGVVGVNIAVLPNMSPEHTQTLLGSRAAVAEVGGALAHLAVVSREVGRTMMVLPRACEILKPGTKVTLNPARCEIVIHDEADATS